MYWVLADGVIAGYGAEGNVAVPRQEFLAAEDVPSGALLTFVLTTQLASSRAQLHRSI